LRTALVCAVPWVKPGRRIVDGPIGRRERPLWRESCVAGPCQWSFQWASRSGSSACDLACRMTILVRRRV